MNFSRSGWFQKYLEFRNEKRLSPQLPSFGIRVVEDPGFHNDLDQAVYYFLQPTGLLYGGLIDFPFPNVIYPKSKYFDSVDKVFMIFVESLFACMVADRHFLLDDLIEEDNRLLPAVDVALGYFLHILPSSIDQDPKARARAGLFGYGEGLHARFEREIARRITRGSKIFAHPDLFNNSFLFLDLYTCLLWQRQTALEPQTASEMRAGLHQNQMRQRETLLKLIICAARAGGTLEKPERRLIEHFLRSSDLPPEIVARLRVGMKKGLVLEEIEIGEEPWIVRRFFLELILLTVLVDRQITAEETAFVDRVAEKLGLWESEMVQSLAALEVFLVSNSSRFGFMREKSKLHNIKARLQERLVLAVKKNLDHIVNEIRETQELYSLLMKAAKTNLSQEEKDKVRDQLFDILKTIPALAVFALPGGGILLPVLIRILPFNVLPSSFED